MRLSFRLGFVDPPVRRHHRAAGGVGSSGAGSGGGGVGRGGLPVGVAGEVDHGLAHARIDRARFLIACFQGVHDGLDTALRALGNVAQGVDGFEQFLPPGDLIPLHGFIAADDVVEAPAGGVDAIKERVELVRAREYAVEDRINLGRAASSRMRLRGTRAKRSPPTAGAGGSGGSKGPGGGGAVITSRWACARAWPWAAAWRHHTSPMA